MAFVDLNRPLDLRAPAVRRPLPPMPRLRPPRPGDDFSDLVTDMPSYGTAESFDDLITDEIPKAKPFKVDRFVTEMIKALGYGATGLAGSTVTGLAALDPTEAYARDVGKYRDDLAKVPRMTETDVRVRSEEHT